MTAKSVCEEIPGLKGMTPEQQEILGGTFVVLGGYTRYYPQDNICTEIQIRALAAVGFTGCTVDEHGRLYFLMNDSPYKDYQDVA